MQGVCKEGAHSSEEGCRECAGVSQGMCIAFTPCGSWLLQDKFFFKSLFHNSRKFHSLYAHRLKQSKGRREEAAHKEGAGSVRGLHRGGQGVYTLWFLVSSKQVFFKKSRLDNSRKFYSLLRLQTETEKRKEGQAAHKEGSGSALGFHHSCYVLLCVFDRLIHSWGMEDIFTFDLH